MFCIALSCDKTHCPLERQQKMSDDMNINILTEIAYYVSQADPKH
jgi:hypothetical protein